ncbi:probable methyltransferase PMT4 [Primulina eburnea]|uniref:probable methyltransferase PMT4 n=1 Tax=Primulina eburnea TaxID=1245227 RepID=UPI003C6C8241
MVHCTQCGIFWDDKDGIFLIEADRVLRPGGYFVLTSATSRHQGSYVGTKKGSIATPFEVFTQKLCWNLLAEQEETFIWQKTADAQCYISRKQGSTPLCNAEDVQSYYRPLAQCISGTTSKHWIPIQKRSSGSFTSDQLEVYGINPEDFFEELEFWRSSLRNYWSLLSPLIFSDHPKRPGDEDPMPPYNMVRNVMDMHVHYGGFNVALLEATKSVWVMNVVPVGEPNILPIIFDQGFAGVLHNWCEPFPTYPRTYDLLHAKGLLSHLATEQCSMVDLIFGMDRILRPEAGPIESTRTLVTHAPLGSSGIDLFRMEVTSGTYAKNTFLRK